MTCEYYREALTADDIAQLYRAGASALSQHLEQIQQQLPQLYTRSASLAETIAACRRSILARSEPLPPELLAAVQTRLRADFPDDYRNLSAWARDDAGRVPDIARPAVAASPGHSIAGAGRRVRPADGRAMGQATPQQRQHWSRSRSFERTFQELIARDAGDSGSADWVQLILHLDPRIEWRPATYEPVAPYVTPSTPATRDLSQTEARDTLQRDWLHPRSTAIRRRSRLRRRSPGPDNWPTGFALEYAQYPDRADFSHELAELSRLEQQVAAVVAADRELYFAVRRIKRKIM